MRKHILFTLIVVFGFALESPAQSYKRSQRGFNFGGVRGRVEVQSLPSGYVEIKVTTPRGTSTDTVIGSGLYPLTVYGGKRSFFVGRFGDSKLPMLLLGIRDDERLSNGRLIAYQITSNGALIGQRVVVDEAIEHGHTDNVVAGRYNLSAVEPEIGAVYSVAYQTARFESYYTAFEKVRVRQWEPTIDGFLETDQGFLRDKNGRLVESLKFYQLPESKKQQLFIANVVRPEPMMENRGVPTGLLLPEKRASR